MNLVFDIGYNVGEFSEAVINKHSNAKIIAVEANENLCTRNRNKNNPNITLLNNLMSDKDDEEIDFYIESKQLGISTASKEFMDNSRFTKGSKNLGSNSANWCDPVKVKSITLDSLINRYGIPNLIKIDVEGFEYNVIRGLNKKAEDICLEWHEEDYDSLLKIVSHLQILGYEKFGVIGWFDEGDVFDKVTFSSKGDPYLEYPNEFYTWEELDMNRLVKSERRINYGMFFAI